jgi:hypothetical protein
MQADFTDLREDGFQPVVRQNLGRSSSAERLGLPDLDFQVRCAARDATGLLKRLLLPALVGRHFLRELKNAVRGRCCCR